MKKLLIIIFILALIVGAFYFVQPAEDKVETLMKNLKQETQIGFSGIETGDLSWIIKTEEGTDNILIIGKNFQVGGISASDYGKVETFFEENGFEADIYNIVDGMVSGLVGYKLDSIICMVDSGFAGYREAEGQWIPPAMDKYDVMVKCGESEEVKLNNLDLITEIETIEADIDENFFISLESNPTTGYQWEGIYDEEYLEFVSNEYVAQSVDLIGSGGNEIFNFVALKPGETEITFSYLRLWEKKPIKEVIYNIIIK